MRKMKHNWFVHAENRETGHKSRVGPFFSAEEAGCFADDDRKPEEWARVTIYGRARYGRVKYGFESNTEMTHNQTSKT